MIENFEDKYDDTDHHGTFYYHYGVVLRFCYPFQPHVIKELTEASLSIYPLGRPEKNRLSIDPDFTENPYQAKYIPLPSLVLSESNLKDMIYESLYYDKYSDRTLLFIHPLKPSHQDHYKDVSNWVSECSISENSGSHAGSLDVDQSAQQFLESKMLLPLEASRLQLLVTIEVCDQNLHQYILHAINSRGFDRETRLAFRMPKGEPDLGFTKKTEFQIHKLEIRASRDRVHNLAGNQIIVPTIVNNQKFFQLENPATLAHLGIQKAILSYKKIKEYCEPRIFFFGKTEGLRFFSDLTISCLNSNNSEINRQNSKNDLAESVPKRIKL